MIRRDAATGQVLVPANRSSWTEFFQPADRSPIPADFMSEAERIDSPVGERDLL